MNARRLVWLLLMLVSVLAGSAAQADSGCASYKVGLYEFGSFYYRDAAEKFVGIDKEVVDEVARRSGCTFVTEMESRVRIWHRLDQGTLDLTTSAMKTPERMAKGDFALYLYSRNFLLISKDMAKRVDTLADFAADPTLKLGVVRSFRHGKTIDTWIESLRKLGRVQEYADAEVLARVYAAGRIQGFFSAPMAWPSLLRRYGLSDKLSKLDVAPHDQILGGLFFPHGRVSATDQVRMRRALDEMRADGTMEKIFARHMDPSLVKSVITLSDL
jgi:polar amino acid transport system substrate-binding protein